MCSSDGYTPLARLLFLFDLLTFILIYNCTLPSFQTVLNPVAVLVRCGVMGAVGATMIGFVGGWGLGGEI
jgi:hypothetical protein